MALGSFANFEDTYRALLKLRAPKFCKGLKLQGPLPLAFGIGQVLQDPKI